MTGEAMFATRLIDRNSGQQIWADEFHTEAGRNGGRATRTTSGA